MPRPVTMRKRQAVPGSSSGFLRAMFMPLAMLAAVTQAPAAGADDWPQFRRDAERTAASRDRVALPLAEIWSGQAKLAPLSHEVAIWRGRLYCVAEVEGRRALVCLDARTGAPRWRQLLAPRMQAVTAEPNAENVGPAVSERGIVFVPQAAVGPLRAFRAADGTPVAVSPPPGRSPEPGVRVLLAHEPPGSLVRPEAVDRTRPLDLGEFLLQGEELLATTSRDLFFSWSPERAARCLLLSHAPTGHLVPVRERPAYLGGYPLARCGGGVVVAEGDYEKHGFLALLGGDGRAAWHRDLPWIAGLPASGDDLLFTGVGGEYGTAGILALAAETGATRWLFAPQPLRPDPATLDSDPRWRRANPGLVVVAGRVFGQAGRAIVALERESGARLWQQRLGPDARVASLVASREHLFASLNDSLVALRLDDGRAEWQQPMPRLDPFRHPGALALASGLLYRTTGEIHAFAPAERTFLLGTDSPRAQEYHAGLPEKEPQRRPPAEVSLLRLRWDRDPGELLEQVRARQREIRDVPLALSLDWLDPTRSRLAGGQPGWTPEREAAFARGCELLARVGKPLHFDVAPEVNVYLARFPEQADGVRRLVRVAARAVHQASPSTKTLVSFNAEVMAGCYGRGSHLPFGPLPLPSPPDLAPLRALVAEVDEIGFTSSPQAGFSRPEQLPADYFLALRDAVGRKPVVIAGLTARCDGKTPKSAAGQAEYLKRLFRACYWLDASLVAYPDLVSESKSSPSALVAADEARPALAVWAEILSWKRVKRLSAAPEETKRPGDAPDPGEGSASPNG